MDDKLIWELNAVKANITTMNAEVKKLEATRDDLSEQILDEMSLANSSLFRTAGADEQGKRITVSVNPEDIANVTDWAEFEEYIYENKALYLLQRRPSNPSYRDEIAVKGELPGVETFTKQKLSLKHV
jgi:hypothetical protein